MSPILGGRSEVFLCPLYEALGYMILENEKAEMDRYDQFIMHLHANPMTDATARENYIKTIEPQSIRQQQAGPMKTDFDQLRRLKARQEKGVL